VATVLAPEWTHSVRVNGEQVTVVKPAGELSGDAFGKRPELQARLDNLLNQLAEAT